MTHDMLAQCGRVIGARNGAVIYRLPAASIRYAVKFDSDIRLFRTLTEASAATIPNK